MNPDALLYRVIETWTLRMNSNIPSTQAFLPDDEDDNEMSVFDADCGIEPEKVFDHFVQDPKKELPLGVLAVTPAECHQSNLSVRSSPTGAINVEQAHVSICFDAEWKRSKKKRVAGDLRDFAWQRGWQYTP